MKKCDQDFTDQLSAHPHEGGDLVQVIGGREKTISTVVGSIFVLLQTTLTGSPTKLGMSGVRA